MGQENNGSFSLSALGLGLVTATLTNCFYNPAGEHSARSTILMGFLSTLGLVIGAACFYLLAMKCQLFSGTGFLSRLGAWIFLGWFGMELVRTASTAQTVCREHFGSNGLIAVLPILLLVSWEMKASALDRSARAVWWLLAAGALVCLAGLGSQMHWQRLFAAEGASIWNGGWPAVPIYPEYFALPLLCQKKKLHQGFLLPFWSYGVQAGYALVLELVLGRAVSSDYRGLELLRAWTLGYFSRLDALLLLLWLTAALWRICLLAYLLRTLWPTCIGIKKNPEIQNQYKGVQT